jgi:replicative DNA helicase
MSFIKNTHYSPELEKAIIGAILLEKTAFGRLYGLLQPEVFYYEVNRDIFEMFTKMWDSNEPIDCVTATLKAYREPKNSFASVCIQTYFTGATIAVVSTANLEYHGLILREMYIASEM